MIDTKGELYFIDFDMAAVVGGELTRLSGVELDMELAQRVLTVHCGTEDYIAPEILQACQEGRQLRYSPAQDWYSLGATLDCFEDLMGNENLKAITHQLLSAPPKQRANFTLLSQIYDESTFTESLGALVSDMMDYDLL